MEEIIYRLKIEICGAEIEISRTVDVYRNTSLKDLHQIIQILFGWEGYHLHEFMLKKHQKIYNNNEDKITVEEIFIKKSDKLTYIYDFGDSWEHKITLVKKFEKDHKIEFYPNLVEAKRAAPQEDSGGIWGWEEMCYVLTNKITEHEMYKEYLEWITGGEENAIIDLYSFSNEDFEELKKSLKKHAPKRKVAKIVPFNLEQSSEKELLKILKKESFSPDISLIKNILSREDIENILSKELETELSRTKITMMKNYCYIANLIFILGELKSSKGFYVASKILTFDDDFLIDLFGDLVNMFPCSFANMGVGHEKELSSNFDDDSVDRNSLIFTALIIIHLDSNVKNNEAEKCLIKYIKNECEKPDFEPLILFSMAIEGFEYAEQLFKFGMEQEPISKKEKKKIFDNLKELKKQMLQERPKNIYDIYNHLKRFEGNKYYEMDQSLMDCYNYFGVNLGNEDFEGIPFNEGNKIEPNSLYNGQQQQLSQNTKISPNQFCPCGSGKKYKKCCGQAKD